MCPLWAGRLGTFFEKLGVTIRTENAEPRQVCISNRAVKLHTWGGEYKYQDIFGRCRKARHRIYSRRRWHDGSWRNRHLVYLFTGLDGCIAVAEHRAPAGKY